MSWGRIDDGFTTHRKVLALKTAARRWTWLEVLTYTWKYRAPTVPDEIADVVRGATPAFLADCERIGLLERDHAGLLVVHDWPIYSDAPVREKVAYWLDRHPDDSANDVCRAIGGTRELVLSEVRKYHQNGTAEPPNGSHNPVRPNQENTGSAGSETGTDPSRPLPNPTGRGSKAGSKHEDPGPLLEENSAREAANGTAPDHIDIQETIAASLAAAAKGQAQ